MTNSFAGRLVIGIVGVLELPGIVLAAEEGPEALIRQGVELRRKGDDARAHGYFKRAYDISHTPRSAAQLGLCEQAIGELLNAETHLTEALSSRDAWVESNRSILESSRTTGRGQLGAVELRGVPAGATVASQRRSDVGVPPDGVVWVEPGETFLIIAAPGHQTKTLKVIVAAGAGVALNVELKPELAGSAVRARIGTAPGTSSSLALHLSPAFTAPHDVGGWWRPGGLVAAGFGVAACIAGIVMYRSATTKLDKIEQDATAMPPRPYDEANGNWRTLDRAGTGFMIGGAVAIATGTVLLLLSRRTGSSKAATSDSRISLTFTPGLTPTLELGARF